MYHQAGSQALYPIYQLKYYHRQEKGVTSADAGQGDGRERVYRRHRLSGAGAAAPARQRQRGYNQSEMIARGIGEVCGRPVVTMPSGARALRSQTTKGRWGRNDNVEGAFEPWHADKIRNLHVLIIDDTSPPEPPSAPAPMPWHRPEG